ncbi:MAG: HlyD family efflux transporter periplasmic adaptor subunit, partial [Planctomycetota bacterium]
MTDTPDQPGAHTTIDAVERLMGAGFAASRDAEQAQEIVRLRSVSASLASVIDTAGAVVAEPDFACTAQALANLSASMFRCARASVGLDSAKTVVVRAIAHTDRVDRGAPLTRLIEEAMNESADQDTEVVVPDAGDRPLIARQHQRLAGEGHPCVLTLPLRASGEVVGALTLERDTPFRSEEVAGARMLCELVTPRLAHLRETDRWFAARLASGLRKLGAGIVGERYTWAKLAALACLAFLCFALFVKGEHRVSAPCTLSPTKSAVVSAPFDGTVREALARAGDAVRAGDALLRLDDADLRLSLVGASAELERVLGEVARAQQDNDLARETEARFRADQARAEIDLLESRLARATLVAPIDGVILDGRWRDRVGAPVREGDAMFSVAPLDELRVELRVDGRDIRHLGVGQAGALATVAFPSRRVGFVVESIEPFARADDATPGVFN